MRILITNVSFYPAHEGGPTNALYWLASGLSHVGYDVRVVTTDKGIDMKEFQFDSWQMINGFYVIYVKAGKWKKHLENELREADVFITCGVCTLWGFYIRMKSLALGKKTIISPRGELFDAAIDHKGVVYGFLKRLFFDLMRRCYNDRIIYHVTSVDEEAVVKRLMRTDKVFCVPNCMILPERIAIRDDKTPYFLYVGRLNPIKALDKLILALSMSELFIKSSFVLRIAGDKEGDYYHYLVELVQSLHLESKVEFLGIIEGDSLNKLYASATWLFLISDSENFGNVVIEALCQSTPVVASKGTPWSVLEEFDAGFWIDNDPSAMSEVIDSLLRMDKEQYQQKRENAFQLSRAFDVYGNMAEWERVIDL